jgi:hypothetical protein
MKTPMRNENESALRPDTSSPSRRDVLLRLALFPVAAAFGIACKSGLDCTDTSALTGPEITQRQSLGYVDKAADATKACKLCNLYQAKGPEECGGCSLMKGPISPEGGCNSFAAKT